MSKYSKEFKLEVVKHYASLMTDLEQQVRSSPLITLWLEDGLTFISASVLMALGLAMRDERPNLSSMY